MTPTSQVKAPCGHPGVVVIGTYVQCAQGCESNPTCPMCQHPALGHGVMAGIGKCTGVKDDGTPCGCNESITSVRTLTKLRAPKRRGIQGHVDFCACGPCTIRRRGREVHIRTKGGKDIRVPWDGVSDKVTFRGTFKDKLRHWKLLDEDGDVLVDGVFSFDTDVDVGWDLDIDFKWDTSKVALSARKLPSGYRGLKYNDYVQSSMMQIPRRAGKEDAYWKLRYAELGDAGYDVLHQYYFEGEPETLKAWKEWHDAKDAVERLAEGRKELRQAAKKANFGHPDPLYYDRGTYYATIDACVEADPRITKWRPTILVHDEVIVTIDATDATDPAEEASIMRRLRGRLKENGFKVTVELATPMDKIMRAVKKVVGAIEIDGYSNVKAADYLRFLLSKSLRCTKALVTIEDEGIFEGQKTVTITWTVGGKTYGFRHTIYAETPPVKGLGDAR